MDPSDTRAEGLPLKNTTGANAAVDALFSSPIARRDDAGGRALRDEIFASLPDVPTSPTVIRHDDLNASMEPTPKQRSFLAQFPTIDLSYRADREMLYLMGSMPVVLVAFLYGWIWWLVQQMLGLMLVVGLALLLGFCVNRISKSPSKTNADTVAFSRDGAEDVFKAIKAVFNIFVGLMKYVDEHVDTVTDTLKKNEIEARRLMLENELKEEMGVERLNEAQLAEVRSLSRMTDKELEAFKKMEAERKAEGESEVSRQSWLKKAARGY